MRFYLLVLISISLSACAASTATSTAEPGSSSETGEPTTEVDMSFQITSDAFANGQSIPAKYSCIGRNISPTLMWTEPPTGTQSFALIMDDPDAPGGTWVHWVLYNIKPDMRSLQEDLPITGKNVDPNAVYIGKNSWGDIGYGGPCPPGGTHRYFFRFSALDTVISLLPGATRDQLLKEMDGHVLAQTELMGTFSK